MNFISNIQNYLKKTEKNDENTGEIAVLIRNDLIDELVTLFID